MNAHHAAITATAVAVCCPGAGDEQVPGGVQDRRRRARGASAGCAQFWPRSRGSASGGAVPPMAPADQGSSAGAAGQPVGELVGVCGSAGCPDWPPQRHDHLRLVRVAEVRHVAHAGARRLRAGDRVGGRVARAARRCPPRPAADRARAGKCARSPGSEARGWSSASACTAPQRPARRVGPEPALELAAVRRQAALEHVRARCGRRGRTRRRRVERGRACGGPSGRRSRAATRAARSP